MEYSRAEMQSPTSMMNQPIWKWGGGEEEAHGGQFATKLVTMSKAAVVQEAAALREANS